MLARTCSSQGFGEAGKGCSSHRVMTLSTLNMYVVQLARYGGRPRPTHSAYRTQHFVTSVWNIFRTAPGTVLEHLVAALCMEDVDCWTKQNVICNMHNVSYYVWCVCHVKISTRRVLVGRYRRQFSVYKPVLCQLIKNNLKYDLTSSALIRN